MIDARSWHSYPENPSVRLIMIQTINSWRNNCTPNNLLKNPQIFIILKILIQTIIYKMPKHILLLKLYLIVWIRIYKIKRIKGLVDRYPFLAFLFWKFLNSFNCWFRQLVLLKILKFFQLLIQTIRSIYHFSKPPFFSS